MALQKEKKNLTNELQALLKDIKKSKHKIKKHVGSTENKKMIKRAAQKEELGGKNSYLPPYGSN